VAKDVGKLPAEGRVDGGAESGLELSGKRNVRKSDALACEEGTSGKMPFKDAEGRSQTILEYVVDLEGYWYLSNTKSEILNARACCRG
jgi:hypothetical protein